MALQLQGANNTIAEVDGTTFRTLRTAPRPIEYLGNGQTQPALSGGHYSTGVAAFGTGLATAGDLFQFRWTSAALLAVTHRIRVSSAIATTFFSAGAPIQLALYKRTSYTVSGSGGTQAVIPGAGYCKERTGMAPTQVGDYRISTTSILSAGTWTQTNAMAMMVVGPPLTGSVNGQVIGAGTVLLESNVASGVHPLVLAQNEGFGIESVAALSNTGSIYFSVEVQWSEVPQY
jgi:hypothetical protein